VDLRDDALRFAQSQAIDYPLLMGETGGLEIANAVGIRDMVLPFTIVANSRGEIVTVKLGELHSDEAAFIVARLGALEAGQLSLEDARGQITDGLRDLAVIRAKDTQTGAN
jgi:hypothetical protein